MDAVSTAITGNNSSIDTATPGGNRLDLVTVIRRALVERRQVVDIGDFKFRFQRFNETFEDDGKELLAMASGIYGKFPATQGGKPAPGRWLHLGSSDDLEVLMTPYLHPLKPQEREALSVSISAAVALRSLNSTSSTPAAPARRMRP